MDSEADDILISDPGYQENIISRFMKDTHINQ